MLLNLWPQLRRRPPATQQHGGLPRGATWTPSPPPPPVRVHVSGRSDLVVSAFSRPVRLRVRGLTTLTVTGSVHTTVPQLPDDPDLAWILNDLAFLDLE